MFDEAWVRDRTAATPFPHLIYTPRTGSTNDDATALLGDDRAAGTVLVADVQRAGRGRRGRRWLAASETSLLFTAVLPQPMTTAALWAVPFWCALGVREGVLRASGITLDLQWPNDLLLSGSKACGILGVSRVTGSQAWVGCGVGLNVRRPRAGAEVDPGAAFLSDAGIEVAREHVLVEILRAFASRLAMLDEPADVAREWERLAGLPGLRYRILEDDRGESDVLALRLAPDGGLIVNSDESERTVALADARVLR